MSDNDSDAGEIKLNHSVLNQDYDGSEDESDSGSDYFDSGLERERLLSLDENTEDNSNVLKHLLIEIADIEPVCKNIIKISVFNKNKKMLNRNEKVDFEINESGYPFIPCDCEEFLWHFLQEMKKCRSELKGTKIITNIKDFKYKF